MSDSIHLGSERYSRAAAILEGASLQTNAAVSQSTVNSELFAKTEMAEAHARRIMETGNKDYIPGIKDNVLQMVRQWLQEPYDPIFTLYGKMGCGKSFFSAHLNAYMAEQAEQYYTVAFSSQQTYRDTTEVRTMLISLANQLFHHVGECSDYFAKQALREDSIPELTEQVLVSALEFAELSKPLLVIIDGLDEYPREDCEEFLETLSRLRDRLNPRLKIYFSSRPEEYICSQMFHDPVTGSYSIENNAEQSALDCLCFIQAKCRLANVQMEEKLQQALVKKCGFSLKYLDCFFNDIRCGRLSITESFIENLPKGLSNYYKDQLIRYFGDKNMEFYKQWIVPLLELLCVVWRPITVDEVCDILDWTPRDVQNVISRSGTLLWNNNQCVMLYQSESIKEFLLDARYCPDKYRIDCANGNRRILDRLKAMIREHADIDSNLYLLEYAADHLLDKDRPTNADWQLMLQLIQNYSHKSDLIRRMPPLILEKSTDVILNFFGLLFMDMELEPILREHFCVRMIAHAAEQNCARADKLLEVFDMLEGIDDYWFMICYGRSRLYRTMGKLDQAEVVFRDNPVQKQEDLLGLYRHNLYLDETCRIYRRKPGSDWRVVTRLHIDAVLEFTDICKKIGLSNLPARQTAMNGLGVAFDQLGRLCESLEKQTDAQLRADCAGPICALLKHPLGVAEQQGYFLLLAAVCYENSLVQTKRCQQFDSRSIGKIYNMHYSFYALGRLYSTKNFPNYSLQRAVTYFDDCLDSVMPIVEKGNCPLRFLDIPIKIYERLAQAFREAGEFQKARAALAQKLRQYEAKVLRTPSMVTEFNRCLCYEQEAQLILESQGIVAAEPYYLEAVRNYRRCAEKYPDEKAQRACFVVYSNVSSAFDKVENWDKVIEYLELSIAEAKRVYGLYPSDATKWTIATSISYLAARLRQRDPKGAIDRCLGMYLESLELRKELAQANPDNMKYQAGPMIIYRTLLDYYIAEEDFATAYFYLRDAAETALACYSRAEKQLNYLYAPLKAVMDVRKKLTPEQLDQWLQTVDPMLRRIDPVKQEENYLRLHFLVLSVQLDRAESGDDRDGKDELYRRFYAAGKAFAFTYHEEKMLQFAVQQFGNYLLRSMDAGTFEQTIAPVQQILEDLSQYIQTHEESKQLQLQSASLYMRFADAVRKHASGQYLSSVIDLYIMASVQCAGLAKHTGKKEFLRNKIHALSKLAGLTERLETNLAQQSVEEKRMRLQLLIKIYDFCAAQKISGAEKKLALYTKMLEELPGEA